MFEMIKKEIIKMIQEQIVGYYKMVLPYQEDTHYTCFANGNIKVSVSDGEYEFSVAGNELLYEIVNIKELCEKREIEIFEALD